MTVVCKRDFLKAKRHHDTLNYIPKWKNPNSNASAKCKCSHPKCTTSERLIQPKFESTDNLATALGIKPSPDHPFLLCRDHYTNSFIPNPLVLLVVLHPKQAPVFLTTHAVSLHLEETTGIKRKCKSRRSLVQHML